MPLEFRGNAICLSGGTGTGLKSELLGRYYPFWWGIASGGKGHQLATTIVDLDAATGEVCMKETGQVVSGSAGHALRLKLNNSGTENLKIILAEKDEECWSRLKAVIAHDWPRLSLVESEGPIDTNNTGVYISNGTLDQAINLVERIDARLRLGRTIFLFDPLLSVPWDSIQRVARRRINSFYKIRTEFIIFLFTSDFFLGRDEFMPLPNTTNESMWAQSEAYSVAEVDALFSGEFWRPIILNDLPIQEREHRLVRLYQSRLHSWFRYVLPLPFAPKIEQVYHLFVCSNFETGVRVTRSFFCDLTHNPKYSPGGIEAAYHKFTIEHQGKLPSLSSPGRPVEFRLLWKVIKGHEEGFCDVLCQDLMKEEPNFERRREALEWLHKEGYLNAKHYEDEWGKHPPTYMLDWPLLKKRLGVEAPPPLEPLLPSFARPLGLQIRF